MSDTFSQALAGKHGKHQQLIAEAVVSEWGELLLRKGRDYGSAIFAPPVLTPDIPASLAIQVRLSDKIGRIKNLLDNPAEVSEESIDDSIFDYAAYRLLQRIANRLESPELSDVAEVQADDPPEEAAEDAPRKTFTHDGITYEIPDGRDIGKLAWVSRMSLGNACYYKRWVYIMGYRPDDGRPYVSAAGSTWKYAVLVPEEDGNDTAGVQADDPPAEEAAEDAPRKIIHLDGVPYEIPDGWQWRLDDRDTGAEEAAEDAPREIVYIDGVPYAIPDERDIGSVVAVSDDSPKDAILSGPNTEILREVERFDSQAMFVDADGSYWAYAVSPKPLPRGTFAHSGVTYEIPDGRDIGKRAWVSGRSLDSACLARVCIRITDYRPDDKRPYVSVDVGEWEYAVLVPEKAAGLIGDPSLDYLLDHIPRYDKAPKGWQFDRTCGIPVPGYVPIYDGVPPLRGGKRGLLRLTPEIVDQYSQWRLSDYDSRFGTLS